MRKEDLVEVEDIVNLDAITYMEVPAQEFKNMYTQVGVAVANAQMPYSVLRQPIEARFAVQKPDFLL